MSYVLKAQKRYFSTSSKLNFNNDRATMKNFLLNFVDVKKGLTSILRRMEKESPYCKDPEIAMRAKLLVLYLNETYEEFLQPGFKTGMKRNNSLRPLREPSVA